MEEARFLLAEKEYREEQAQIFARAEKALASRTWHEAVVEYKEAAYETLREIKEDVAARPLYYGAQVGECIPGGVGAVFTVGNKGYDVATGASTVSEASQELAFETAIGVIGGTAVKKVGKAGKFVIGKFGSKIAEKRMAKVIQFSQNDVPIVWGKGIKQQGMPWEDYLAKQMDPKARLPKNFKTFDFFERTTGTAISAKTLNTQTAARLDKPKQIYYSLKRNIDKAAGFEKHELSKVKVLSEDIKVRKLEVAIPSGTGRPQLQEIQKAIKYGEKQSVNVNITVVK
jgi:hypothetical protein